MERRLNPVSLDDILGANKLLDPVIVRTQFSRSHLTSERLKTEVFFKFENEQRTGSFKIRGAMNKISSLSADERARGIICCSAGNHAQGVAYSAALLGVKAVVVMPRSAALVKVSATQGYGAEVILEGDYFDEAFAYARELGNQKGYCFVHPFEDEKIVAGQGTLALEILQNCPELDTVIVPVGGGGLISGVGSAFRALNPKARVIGVQTEVACAMTQLFQKSSAPLASGAIMNTIADGIAVKQASQAMYDSYLKHVVDEMMTVTEDEIAEAIVYAIETLRAVVEGSGAAALAALLCGRLRLGHRNCVVLSGGNIDLNIFAKVIERGLQKKGRIVSFSVIVPDLPGSLSRMTQIIASMRANVLEVHHDRVAGGLGLKETVINFVIETTGHTHIEQIRKALLDSGARFIDQ